MTEPLKLITNPEEILQLKGELQERWQQLPPEHQATMALVLLQDVLDGEYAPWMWGALDVIGRGEELADGEMPRRRATPNNTSHEHPTPPTEESLPQEGFGFTEQERLYNRVSDERFKTFLDDPQTTIHQINESTNNYGEFLFVTVSRPAGDRRECVTYWGLGYHEYRERWYVDRWEWYRANQFPETMAQQLSREEAEELLQRRREYVAASASEEPQSERAKLFEFLADLTDDDGACTEMEDLGDLAPWLLGDAE